MADLARIIGSSPYGVSSYRQSLLLAWRLVLFGQGRGVADSEGNLIGSVLAHAAERAWVGTHGAGLLALCTPGASGVANVARLHSGAAGISALIGGDLVELRSSADSVTLDVSLTAPPASGTRTDLIYLEAWLEEIQPTISPEAASSVVYKRGNTSNATPLTNDLIVVASTETARRLQLRYAIRSAAGAVGLSGITTTGYTYTAGPTPGEYLAGDGSASAAIALSAADGYKRAIVLATVARSVGVTTIAAIAITASAAQLIKLGGDAAAVDTFSAFSTPTASQLLVLDGTGKYAAAAFTGLVGAATDVDTVDTFHANATPGASRLLPLSAASKYPNSVMRTGINQGLDADTVDGYHASATPAANKLLTLDGVAKLPNSALRTGSGQGLDADSVDGRGVIATPTALMLLPLDSSAKYPNSALRTGSGAGIDADKVDNAHAASTPAAGTLLKLDAGGQFPNSALYTGAGNGLDADTLDGLQSSALALTSHASGATIVTVNGVLFYAFPAGKNVGLNCWYVCKGYYNANTYLDCYLTLYELTAAGSVVWAVTYQDSAPGLTGEIVTKSINFAASYALTNVANHFHIAGSFSSGNFVPSFNQIAVYGWYY